MGKRLGWVLERLLSFDGLLPGFDDLPFCFGLLAWRLVVARGTENFGLSSSWIESVIGSGHTLYDGRLSQAMLEATRYSGPFAPSEVLSVAVELNEQIVKVVSRCCITPGAGQEHYSLVLVSLCDHGQLSFGLLYIFTRLRIL